MTSDDFQGILSLCEVTRVDGWAQLPEGRLLTLHLASGGVGLTVSRITQLREVGTQIQVRTARDETYVFALADAFACGFEDSGSKARKAGFV
jgi:hypothetical protein